MIALRDITPVVRATGIVPPDDDLATPLPPPMPLADDTGDDDYDVDDAVFEDAATNPLARVDASELATDDAPASNFTAAQARRRSRATRRS